MRCCDYCCRCIPYSTRESIQRACIWFWLAAVVAAAVLAAAAFTVVRHVSITVEDASLSRFDLASSPEMALAYNLSLTLSISNRNWAMSIKHTKAFEAAYKFVDQQFDRVLIVDEGTVQHARETMVYHLSKCSESSYVALGSAGVAEYKKENKTQVFEVEVALSGEVSYTARVTKCKIEATCPLMLQLTSPGTAAVVFHKVDCMLAKPEKNC
ncbi:hypothetical protein BAE44_0015674 [Dichanthelium oligosanthes]|uniref:Late embryogenesis abundant protein LEA-2 subgroup domain-containing protein n=1 Tax=Dichanthelium oligosanthes TaxID=888268 RepID=A0A1E5VDT6_9POAL|nr:hypothetical protein BAE44_0015674 [Dichanthelium oligosanthes]